VKVSWVVTCRTQQQGEGDAGFVGLCDSTSEQRAEDMEIGSAAAVGLRAVHPRTAQCAFSPVRCDLGRDQPAYNRSIHLGSPSWAGCSPVNDSLEAREVH